ncbi:MAG: hypothetical protein H0X02_06045 [Nitrosomonas sp.]|nr:hypothetical protein [Nitrosomonas sp.]
MPVPPFNKTGVITKDVHVAAVETDKISCAAVPENAVAFVAKKDSMVDIGRGEEPPPPEDGGDGNGSGSDTPSPVTSPTVGPVAAIAPVNVDPVVLLPYC